MLFIPLCMTFILSHPTPDHIKSMRHLIQGHTIWIGHSIPNHSTRIKHSIPDHTARIKHLILNHTVWIRHTSHRVQRYSHFSFLISTSIFIFLNNTNVINNVRHKLHVTTYLPYKVQRKWFSNFQRKLFSNISFS